MSKERQELIAVMAVAVSKSLATERRFTYIDDDGRIVVDLPLLADVLIEQGYTKDRR